MKFLLWFITILAMESLIKIGVVLILYKNLGIVILIYWPFEV